ncbi:MAG: ABC transporter permease [Treponema sp.]|nr:ABC transporter permease [Treponema sp.]
MKNNVTYRAAPFVFIFLILCIWQLLSVSGLIPGYMLPSPLKVVKAFCKDMPLLMYHLEVTLLEAFAGIIVSILFAFVFAIVMDRFTFINRAVYPVLIVSQTIPTIAIAPLLILWFGYGMSSKVILIVLTCFFPITVSLLTGFASVDKDMIRLMESMGASRLQIMKYAKLPSSVKSLFAGLRISISYSIIGAVISEWLGGMRGLGVYMTRVKKSYSYDKLFAVIFLISALSLILIKLISCIEKRICSYEK